MGKAIIAIVLLAAGAWFFMQGGFLSGGGGSGPSITKSTADQAPSSGAPTKNYGALVPDKLENKARTAGEAAGNSGNE
ncbi:MAG: hypothetical protein HY791_09420 [Deltaproteobacteria bacterium]|nr:hypothetical protein [Deltaproteobacteria bacterium]